MSSRHTQGFPGFHWQNFTGAEAGNASTSPRLPARTAAVSKKPSSLSHALHRVSVSTSLSEQDLDFLPTRSQITPWDGSSLCTWAGMSGFGSVCCFGLPDEQIGLKARDYPQLRHWEMLSQRVTPTPWAPRRDVCSGSGHFLSLRATTPGGFPSASVHHLSNQPTAQSGTD